MISPKPEYFDHLDDPAVRKEALGVLMDIWGDVGRHLETGAGRLGALNGGTHAGENPSVWAQTHHRPTQDMVNLTIEFWPGEFSFNVVGWFDQTWRKLSHWIGKLSARKMLNELPEYDLLLFARIGVGSGEKVVWQGAPFELRQELKGGDPEVLPVHWPLRMDSFEKSLEPGKEKPAAHLRRRWTTEEALAAPDLADQISAETERWLAVLDEINLGV